MAIPAFGICGWSGSGKTTLIERLLPRLAARGLTVAVLKHDAHRLDVDRPGKDTDRFFRAGAQCVYAYDKEQLFQRSRGGDDSDRVLRQASAEADLVLIEGLKRAPLPKMWLVHPDREEDAELDEHVLATLDAGPERADQAEALIVQWLEEQWKSREQWFGILIGGESKRMGRPKSMLRLGGHTVVEAIHEEALCLCPNIAFLGDGPLPDTLREAAPAIPDAPGVKGPLAGVLAAMRWNPAATWTFVACDMPAMSAEFLNWLSGMRKPGRWAIVPRLTGTDRIEPLASTYEPQMLSRFEALAHSGDFGLQKIRRLDKVAAVSPPPNLIPCLANANTPDEWHAITGSNPAL